MSRLVPIALAGLCIAAAAPAAAQDWDRRGDYGSGYDAYGDAHVYGGDGYGRTWRDERRHSDWNAVPSTFDWRSQLDRPGDYRCDAFWDAGRNDCGARWRDQRHRVSPEARRDYRELAGYGRYDGYGHDRYGYVYGDYDGYRYGYDRFGSHRRGYGAARGYGYGSGSGSATYYGAYGRPDHVYPASGYAAGGRDPGRIAWCRARYRSYDPGSGYYRAWSGRLVWCG